jgi:hypothetical protein
MKARTAGLVIVALCGAAGATAFQILLGKGANVVLVSVAATLLCAIGLVIGVLLRRKNRPVHLDDVEQRGSFVIGRRGSGFALALAVWLLGSVVGFSLLRGTAFDMWWVLAHSFLIGGLALSVALLGSRGQRADE